MKKIISLLLLLPLLLLVSCIDNDIPYPIVKGNVTLFEAVGQLSAEIDPNKRTINVVLSDTVNIERVVIRKFTITDGAQCNLDTIRPLNMSKKIDFNIITYQQYDWQITATQPVERVVKVENQIGSANIDALNKIVIVYVSAAQDVSKIKVLEMKLGSSNAITLPEPIGVTNFTRPQIFYVSQFGKIEEWKIYVFKE